MAMKTLEIIQKRATIYGHHDGFLYSVTGGKEDVKYWRCRNNDKCKVKMVTVSTARSVLIRKGGDVASHTDDPDPEEVEALRYVARVKAAAAENSDRPPLCNFTYRSRCRRSCANSITYPGKFEKNYSKRG